MIKEVIKRDGRIETFNPGKLNRWGTWAAEGLGDLADWGKVVMRAAADLPDRCTSEELQEKLIQVAMDQRTWSYYLMAGRLYAAHIRKIIYDSDELPSIRALHTKLQDLGLMRQLDYTDAEYEQIEELIDHTRDFAVPHFSLHHLRNKYAVMNRVTKEEYESQQFTYMRMAMTLSENEPKSERLTHVANFYKYLSLKKLSAPTPNFVNLGTLLESYASCCLYAAGDDAKSLAIGDHIAYLMTVSSAGIGSNIMSRSENDPVRGGVLKHQGKPKSAPLASDRYSKPI